MKKRINMIGLQFGRLTVLKRVENDKQGKPVFLCSCQCGQQKAVRGKSLRTGKTASCGCLVLERFHPPIKHGMCKSGTYQTWSGMLARCRNPKDAAYNNYGGRGISVCERWLDFSAFLADMGERQPNLTLERLDVNGDYTKENCAWVSKAEQARNKRNTVRITYAGETKHLDEWAEALGIPKTTIRMRYYRGLAPEQVLCTHLHKSERVMYEGEIRTYPEISKLCGVPYVTLRWRIRKGWPLEKATQH